MRKWFNNIFIYACVITLVSCISFFLISGSLSLMAFSGEMFYYSFEFWRIITFPFIHVDIGHLLQNIAAIGVITFLAYEVNLGAAIYLGSFFTVSLLIALIAGAVVPAIIIAGLSMGIYAIIGAISIKGSNFIPKKIIIPLFAAAAFIEPVVSMFEASVVRSSAFHMLGFILGIAFIITVKQAVPKRRVLAPA